MRYANHFETSVSGEDQRLNEVFEAVRQEAESGHVGYYHLPKLSRSLIEEAQALQASFMSRFDTIAVIGIGGSSLGIKAIDRLLRPYTPQAKKIVYLENSDPLSIIDEISQINKSTTLFIVISKSGGTVETLSIFKRLIATFELDLEQSDQVMVISDDGSILSRFADENGLRRFVIPDNVGGRFSVLSAVGIIPLSLAGFDTAGLLKGAEEFLERFWKREEDHTIRKALYYVANAESLSMNVLFGYSDAFGEFGKWVVQLWGESLGKKTKEGKRVGLTPISLIGSVDQHSFLQLIIEGPLNKTVTFMHIEHSEEHLMIPEMSLVHLEKSDFVNGVSFNALINAQCMATMQSVVESGVSVDEIVWECVDAPSVGEMIIYYEVLTSLCGALFDVNTYDQPGVELGKKILNTFFTK